MGKITADQSRQIIATLMLNTNWDGIDFGKSGLQDAIIRDPKGAGARFTAFLKNGANMQLTDGSKAPTPAAKPSILNPLNDNVQLDAVVSYDPSGFKTRPGLWVSDEFHSRVGSKAKPFENLGASSLSSFGLAKNAYDKDIESDSNMPANYVFESESEFVAYLDQMIQKQPEGKEGDLLNNGYWNIFYVADYVVRVRWSSDRRGWYVDAWSFVDDRWRAGGRVFARN